MYSLHFVVCRSRKYRLLKTRITFVLNCNLGELTSSNCKSLWVWYLTLIKSHSITCSITCSCVCNLTAQGSVLHQGGSIGAWHYYSQSWRLTFDLQPQSILWNFYPQWVDTYRLYPNGSLGCYPGFKVWATHSPTLDSRENVLTSFRWSAYM